MTSEDSDPYDDLHFKYILIAVWTTETIAIFIILFIELRTYYKLISHVHTKTLENMPSKSVSNPSTSSVSPNTPVPSKTPQIAPTKLLFILTIVPYIFYIINGISGVYAMFGFKSCTVGLHAGPIAYVLGKCFMYIVYISRLHIVYSDSTFAYNPKILVALFVCVIMNAIFQITFFEFFVAFYIKIYNYPNGERLCRVTLPKTNLITTAMLDLLIASLCTYLFIRPLLILDREQNQTKCNDSFSRIVLKYSLLAFISVSSTVLILGGMAVTNITSIVTMDIVINCVCLMFFSDYYDYHYKIVCCGAIVVWHRLFPH
eukprot:1002429_1